MDQPSSSVGLESPARLQVIGCDQQVAPSIRAAVQGLAQRRVLREVLTELAARETPAIVLKGHALTAWLYPLDEVRATGDIDLLLPTRESVNGIMAWLDARGFVPVEAGFAGDMVCFEIACLGPARNGREVEVDLHWRLSNLPMFAFRFEFAELLAGTRLLPALHPHARGLGPVHALLHACMHRAQNMPEGIEDEPKWLRDIELLVSAFSPDDWQEFQRLAVERGLAEVCVAAIEAACGGLETTVPAAVAVALREASSVQGMDSSRMSSWWYVQWQCWRAIPRLRWRWRWLRQRLWPTPLYLRHRHGPAVRSIVVLRALRFAAGLRRAVGRSTEESD